MSSKKLYVGGLAYSVDDNDLRSLFAPLGNIAFAKVITDFGTGRSKGFGFVEMSSPEEAEKAIQELNGSTHEGRTIVVSEARPLEPRPNRSSHHRGGRNRGGAGSNSRNHERNDFNHNN